MFFGQVFSHCLNVLIINLTSMFLITALKAKLDIATAGVTNATTVFSLATKFSHLSQKYFYWALNLKT